MDDTLRRSDLNSFEKVDTIVKTTKIFENQTHVEKSVVFRDFTPNFKDGISGMRHIVLNLN